MSSKIRSIILNEILNAIMSNEINKLYEFGEFRLDGERHKLWQNDELILLSPKATELLALLLERNGKFVSKEEIFETVWKDTFVEDGVLTQNIYLIRKILGNDSDGQPLIENKTRLGYRITVPILVSDAEVQQDSSAINQNINQQIPAFPRRKVVAVSVFIAVSILLISIIGYRYFRPNITAFFRKPIESVKFTQLTNTGELTNVALSSDGNVLAFIRGDKVFLKDVISNKEIPLDIPNVRSFSSLQFSADGNFIYFRNNKSPYVSAKVLKTSRFGGDFKVVAEQAQGSFSLSPDNKFLAYYLRKMPDPNPRLIVRNIDTNEEREIFQAEGPIAICETCSPAWSADGKKIIHVTKSWTSQPAKLYVIDVESGTNETMNLPKLRRFEQAAWFPDGQSFVVSASEDAKTFHLWKVYYPNGDAQRMTNGLNSYQNTVISADGKKLIAMQTTENANIFTANTANLNEQKPLTNGNSNAFGQTSLIWFDEQNIIFSSQGEQDLVENLWSIDSDGRSKHQLTNESKSSVWLPSSDGKFIYCSSLRNGFSAILRLDAEGQNLTVIANETDGGRRSPQISPDGNWLYYAFRNKDGGKTMRRNLLTQTEETFFENEKVQCGYLLALSSDGKYLACPNWQYHADNHAENYIAQVAIFSTEDKNYLKFVTLANSLPVYRFSPDGKAIEFIANLEDGTQIMRQGFDESEPKPILSMPKDRIFNFAWSKSGKNLAISRGQQIRDAVLLSDFDK